MIQLTPQSRIFLATAPVDFRKGIDGLAAVCRQVLGDNPLEPTFKGVWSTVANFAPLPLSDTRCGQYPQPHK
jgi:hypothetical protein